MRDLLGKLTRIDESMKSDAKKPTGPKFPGYWKGTDKNPPKPGQGFGSMEEGQVINIKRGGYNQFRDRDDFLDKRDYVQQQLTDPRQRENYNELRQRLHDINNAGRRLGYIK